MDNLKDIDMVNKKELFPQKYKGIKKIKRKIYEN
jgi:hypothetical protein